MGLQEWGSSSLPYIYLGSLGTTIIYSFVFGILHRKVPLRNFFVIISIFLITVNLVFFPVIQIPEYKRYVALFYYWFTSIFSIASVTLFWSIFNLFSSESAIKSNIGFIAASGTIGAIASSFLIPHIVRVIPVQFILLTAVICFTIAQFLTGRIIFSKQNIIPNQNGKEIKPVLPDKNVSSEIETGTRQKFISAYNHPVIKLTFIIIFSMTFTTTFLDFRYQKMIESVLRSQNDKTIFFSDVFLYANTLTFILEFIFMRCILNYFRLKNVLFVLPFLLLFFFPFLYFSFDLTEILLTWSLFIGLEYSINKAGREVLFNSLGDSEKISLRNLSDLIGFRLGSSVCSIFLLVISAVCGITFTAQFMIPFCILLIVFWLFSVWRYK